MKPTALAGVPVRVSLPASVASDISSLKKAVASVLDWMGCPACCSGRDIMFELQRDLVIHGKLSDRAQVGAISRINVAQRAEKAIYVGLQPEAVAKIDDVFIAIERIAELSGHPACATGCDMHLGMERSLVMDTGLGIKEQVMRFG